MLTQNYPGVMKSLEEETGLGVPGGEPKVIQSCFVYRQHTTSDGEGMLILFALRETSRIWERMKIGNGLHRKFQGSIYKERDDERLQLGHFFTLTM